MFFWLTLINIVEPKAIPPDSREILFMKKYNNLKFDNFSLPLLIINFGLRFQSPYRVLRKGFYLYLSIKLLTFAKLIFF